MTRRRPAAVARLWFEAAVRPAPAEIDVVAACLAIAAEEYPRLDVDACRASLHALATRARRAVGEAAVPQEAVARLSRFLFDEEGFHGNVESYDDPRSSFLSDVLERRTGLPILLSLIYMEAGRAAGLAVEGIGLPGHFVVRVVAPDPIYVDPFHGGKVLSREECGAIVARHAGAAAPVAPFLEPVPSWRIVTRMLANLKAAHLRREQHGKAVAALERLVHLDPTSAEARDLGILYLRLGYLPWAQGALGAFVASHPTHPDTPAISRGLPAIAAMAFPPDRFLRRIQVRKGPE